MGESFVPASEMGIVSFVPASEMGILKAVLCYVESASCLFGR